VPSRRMDGIRGSNRPREANASLMGQLVRRLVLTYVNMMSATIAAMGLVLWLHSVQNAGLVAEEGLQAVRTMALMLLSNFALPFFDNAAAVVGDLFQSPGLSDSLTAGVWNFWLPLMFGSVLLVYGGLGFLCSRVKSVHPALLVPFGLVAAVMLVWQVEVNMALAKVAQEEVLPLEQGQTSLKPDQQPFFHLFELSYDKFKEALRDFGCKVGAGSTDAEIWVECQDDSVEAQLLQVVITQICDAPVVDDPKADAKAVQMCVQQGQQLGIIPVPSATRDDAFCKCRRLAYSKMQYLTSWSMAVWFAQFFAVCAIMYFGVEPNLQKMPASQRRDVRAYGVVMMAVVIARVIMHT